MRIAVTGREGQVVRSLAERAERFGHEIVPVGRPELDLAGNAESIRRALAATSPEAIVSAAAYTAVDRAEMEPDLAFAINERGARAVAEAARHLNVPLVHVSTDYVFAGTKGGPYNEVDPTAPAGIYGASKLAGERAVTGAHGNSVILRTAWIYSPFGSNFARTMLRLASKHDEIAVVADQRGSPTSAIDIADGMLRVIENLCASDDPQLRGTFHVAGTGEATWADFAEAIFSTSASLGGPSARVRRIPTADYQMIANRPANSRLDCSKLHRVHGVRLPDWRSSLPDILRRLMPEFNSMRASDL